MPRTKQTGYCITDKCYRKAIKRGYCGKHYLKWYRANKGKCMREDCSNVAQSRGLCSRHYQQSLRNKDALVYPTAANCDHPVWKSFTHKFPVCYSNPYWRGKPLWVLDEQENEYFVLTLLLRFWLCGDSLSSDSLPNASLWRTCNAVAAFFCPFNFS